MKVVAVMVSVVMVKVEEIGDEGIRGKWGGRKEGGRGGSEEGEESRDEEESKEGRMREKTRRQNRAGGGHGRAQRERNNSEQYLREMERLW